MNQVSWKEVAALAVSTVLMLVFGLTRGYFADSDAALKAASEAGLTEAVVIDHRWMTVAQNGCLPDDAAQLVVRGTRDGEPADLKVCMDWPFRGVTAVLE